MIKYVLGFYFTDTHCLLINQGKHTNGIGGKLKHGETREDAMIREFHEETGIKTTAYDWQYVMAFGGSSNKPRHDDPYSCTVFKCEHGNIQLPFEHVTSEGIVKAYPIGHLPANVHPTCEWIYRMILDDVFVGWFTGEKN